jgi:hypothetical protein
MVALAQTDDTPAIALAERYPLLLKDVSDWARIDPASTRYSQPGKPVSLVRRSTEILLNWQDPAAVLERLDRGRVLHFFPNVAGFLAFLGRPGIVDCIRHENWVPLPLIPLRGNQHAQQWLAATPPRDWPWAILEQSHFPDPAFQTFGQGMAQLLNQRATRLCAEMTPRYANRPTPAGILQAGERPLRVVAFAIQGSAYQAYCARDLADAFNVAGHEAQAFVPENTLAVHFELIEAVHRFDPDVLLLNGKYRPDCPGMPENLCVLSWDQDYMLAPKQRLAADMRARDLLMVMIKDWQQDAESRGLPAGRVAHVNLGVNCRLYHPPVNSRADAPVGHSGTGATTGAHRPTFEYDVLFVGNNHTFEDYKKIIEFDKLDEVSQRLMLLARQRLAEWVATRTDGEAMVIPEMGPFLVQCLAELGLGHGGNTAHFRFIEHYFRYRVAHLLLRELYVNALAEFRLGLFGRGWNAFPAVAHLAQPEVANGEPLLDLIHRSAINIHLHTWTVHHPRLYDTAAAGGFLLVGRVPEANPLETSFTPGRELDTFGSIAEMKRKIRHYLDHPRERQEIADRAAERARREHAMEHRAAEMTRFLESQPHA